MSGILFFAHSIVELIRGDSERVRSVMLYSTIGGNLGILNAANSRMLGCFVTLHGCIDNAIHSAADVQLRLACNEIMRLKGTPEPTEEAVLTPGFNLPAKYVMHTVGPIVKEAMPTTDYSRLPGSCYRSRLNRLTSVAFC